MTRSAHRLWSPNLRGTILLAALLWPPVLLAAGAREAFAQEDARPAGQARPVSLTTSDGLRLHAVYWAGKDGGMGVVLVHMASRSSEDWRRLAERLANNGVHAIAVDLRGHGKSTTNSAGQPLTYDALTTEDFQAMVADVGAAVRFLRDETTANPDKILLLGASLGANLAIQYAAGDAKIANVMLLSPGLEYKGVTSENAVERYGDRPLFIAVSKEDRFAAKSALVLDALAKGKKYLKIYSGAGHGTKMLSREPSLEPTLFKWMYGTLIDDVTSVDPVRPPIRSPE